MMPTSNGAARPPRRPRLLATLLLPLVIVACATEDAVRPVAPVDAPALLAARLPPAVAGFRRGTDAAINQPLAGVEVAYATEGRQAAGFVQVLRPPGASPPPDGTASELVQEEYRRWREETARGLMRSRRLTVVAEFDEPAAAPLFRCAALEGSYGRQPVQSQICVGAAGGQLLRLRASMPRRNPPVADPRAFAREIAGGLRGQPVMAEMPPLALDPGIPASGESGPAVPVATPRATGRTPPARTTTRATAPARAGAAPVRAAPRAGTTAPAPSRR
jgi:hypothetical protein